MVITQRKSRRKPTGGRFQKSGRAKRRFEKGSAPMLTKLGTVKTRNVRTLGGARKERLLRSDVANVYDPKTKKYSKAKIKTILENEANRHYVRRNIMTKGTVIDTDKGKAKITSRPGQEGTINAVLV